MNSGRNNIEITTNTGKDFYINLSLAKLSYGINKLLIENPEKDKQKYIFDSRKVCPTFLRIWIWEDFPENHL